MKILLLNDTGLVPHAGCQAVSDAHARMLGRRGHEITKRYFLGELGDFAGMAETEAIAAILRNEQLVSEIQSIDAVVLNGEGTIHHGAGLQWLAMLGAAQRCRKMTVLANTVFEATNGYDDVLRCLDDFVVRDERSAAFARSRRLRCRIALDSCLEAHFDDKAIKLDSGPILVTDWHEERQSDVGAACLSLLCDSRYKSVYLPLHVAEAKLCWRNYPSTMARHAVMVTARHHGVYFSVIARKPFVPLGSNTHKIEGLLEFVKAGFGVANSKDRIVEQLIWCEKNQKAFDEIFDRVQEHLPLDTFSALGGALDPSGEERETARLVQDVERRRSLAADAEWGIAMAGRRLKSAMNLLKQRESSPSPSTQAICTELVNKTPDDPSRLLIASRICTIAGCHREGYVAADRLLITDPHNEEAWRQLSEIVSQADLELGYWIGLRANWSKRVDVMVAAVSRLIDESVPPKYITEILPGPDWPSTVSEEFWGRLRSVLTAGRLAWLGSFLNRNDRAADGNRLLRKAVDETAGSLEAALMLISVLLGEFKHCEARDIARKAIGRWPKAAGPRLMLARIERELRHHQEAAHTLQDLLLLEPENPHAWLEYGQLSRVAVELPIGTGERAFARLSAFTGNEPDLIEKLADYYMSERRFGDAAAAYERLFSANPDAMGQPPICLGYARSLANSGRLEEAAKTINRGIEAATGAALAATGEDRERILSGQSMLLWEGGRYAEANKVQLSIRRSTTTAGWRYDRPEYLPDTRWRLQKLRDFVASRDVIIFLHGPSFVDFSGRLGEIAAADFVTATLGAFHHVDEELSRKIGRGVDVVLITAPNRLRAWFSQLQDFLSRRTPNMLITSRYAMSTLPELGTSEDDFLARYDERLLYVHPAGGPPLPSQPLHFEPANSFALLLPLVVLGRPKRIFVVGADGGAIHRLNRPYFFSPDVDAAGAKNEATQNPDIVAFDEQEGLLNEANRRWRNEAAEADIIVRSALRDLALIFDVPTPPIFNVCPHSSHAAFAKIGYDDAVAMITDRRAAMVRHDYLAQVSR